MIILFTSLQKGDMMDTIENRRTICKYQQKDIMLDLLNDLLETSFCASTMGGMQLYSVVVTRDVERREILSLAHFSQPMIKSAPVMPTFCAGSRCFYKYCQERGAKPGYDNLMSSLNTVTGTLLVTQTFYTSTEGAGSGICYLGATTYNPRVVIDALYLPELVFPITTVTVGYPTEPPKQVDCLSMEGIVHEGSYHGYTAEDINRLYAYEEFLLEDKQFIEENRKETLVQVFTDVYYTKKDNEFMSENLLKVLCQQGFMSDGQQLAVTNRQ